jgi:hypothetical protein
MAIAATEQSGTPWIADCSHRFEQAAARTGIVSVPVSIAGRWVALQFAGEALVEKLTTMLSGTARRGAEPAEFAIRIWDTVSSGVEPPPPPAAAEVHRGYASLGGGEVRLAYSAVSSTLYALRQADRVAYGWVRDANGIRPWEIAAPFRALLGWWVESWGGVMAHAAVVGTRERGILLAGPSGAGKSTSALACAAVGLGFLGDDCAVITDGPRPEAHALYRAAKLGRSMLGRALARLEPWDTRLPSDRDKAILRLEEPAAKLLRSATIAAVVAHRVGERSETSLRRATAAEVLASLAPSTLLQNPGSGQASLEVLARVVRRCECFTLEAGRDLDELAAKLGELAS